MVALMLARLALAAALLALTLACDALTLSALAMLRLLLLGDELALDGEGAGVVIGLDAEPVFDPEPEPDPLPTAELSDPFPCPLLPLCVGVVAVGCCWP